MKICFLSAGIPSNVGGVESVVDELSSYLSRNKIDVTVIGRTDRDFVERSQNRTIIGFRPPDYLPKTLHFANYEGYNFELGIWRALPKERFDVIHGGNDNSFLLLLFSKNSPRSRAPIMLTFHGTQAGSLASERKVIKPYHYFMWTAPEAISARRCDLAVACSQQVKRELQIFYGTNPNKIKVIYNGINTQRFRPLEKAVARRELGLPAKIKYGIWVGTNPKRKGLDLAIKAVSNMSNVRLLVIGLSGRSDDKVIYLGRVSEKEKILAYNSAHFFLFPTLYEGFAITPLEAMACGLPLVISKDCSTREIIADKVHGFVIEDRKPESYAEKIELLLGGIQLQKEFSANCRTLAEKYSWEIQGKKYLEIYKELI